MSYSSLANLCTDIRALCTVTNLFAIYMYLSLKKRNSWISVNDMHHQI